MRLALRLIALTVALLPFRALRALGAVLGEVARWVGIRRAHVEQAMKRAGIPSPRAAAAGMYRALGASLLELVWLSGRRRARLDGLVAVEGASRAEWERVRTGGRGVVLAASHTGNWDLAACAVAQEVELLVVTKRLTARALDEFWQATRAARGVKLTEAGGALARARATLVRGGAVAMMIDQVPSSARRAVRVDFLGAPAYVDRAPAVLAAQTGAPLVVAAACRDARQGGHELRILGVLEPPTRAPRSWIEDATRQATLLLERFVLDHPSEWLWLHRRWRTPASALL